VATISRLLKIIGLFCKSALSKRRYSAKETYHFKEPTNRRHLIAYHSTNCNLIKNPNPEPLRGRGRGCGGGFFATNLDPEN